MGLCLEKEPLKVRSSGNEIPRVDPKSNLMSGPWEKSGIQRGTRGAYPRETT